MVHRHTLFTLAFLHFFKNLIFFFFHKALNLQEQQSLKFYSVYFQIRKMLICASVLCWNLFIRRLVVPDNSNGEIPIQEGFHWQDSYRYCRFLLLLLLQVFEWCVLLSFGIDLCRFVCMGSDVGPSSLRFKRFIGLQSFLIIDLRNCLYSNDSLDISERTGRHT